MSQQFTNSQEGRVFQGVKTGEGVGGAVSTGESGYRREVGGDFEHMREVGALSAHGKDCRHFQHRQGWEELKGQVRGEEVIVSARARLAGDCEK